MGWRTIYIVEKARTWAVYQALENSLVRHQTARAYSQIRFPRPRQEVGLSDGVHGPQRIRMRIMYFIECDRSPVKDQQTQTRIF